MKVLTWAEFDEAADAISFAYSGMPAVYGFPRGGLCLAVAVSHRLGIPLLLTPEPGCLVVDDIYETGKTMSTLQHLPGCRHVVWISKVTPTWFQAVKTTEDSSWILFPWESLTHAKEDHDAYHASRQ